MADDQEELGVSKNAYESEKKNALRKKAMQFHADKNKAADGEEKFKEINKACEVLTDQNNRAGYDQFGDASEQPGGGFEGFGNFTENFGDIFGDIFGNCGDIFGNGRRTNFKGESELVIVKNIKISFIESIIVGSMPCRSVTQEVAIINCLPKTACLRLFG